MALLPPNPGVPSTPLEALVVSPSTPTHGVGGILRTFSALRQRNYRLYFFGQLVSLLGTSMQTIGQAWLVLQLTHSAFQLGVVGALQLTPTLLFSLGAGVLADRWPKRRVLLCTQTAAALQAFILWLLVATGAIQVWQIYVLAFLLGMNACLDVPTRMAFLAEIAGRDDVPNATALNSALINLARIVGPSIAGVVIAATGVTVLFLLNAISYVAILVALAAMDAREFYREVPNEAVGSDRVSAWESLREGLVYLWHTPDVFLPIVVSGLVLLFGSNFNVVLPIFATAVLHSGARGFGFLSAGLGAGSLVGALYLAWRNPHPKSLHVLLGGAAFTLALALFALSHIFSLSLVLIAAVGLGETLFVEVALILTQLLTPDALRGRVMSVMILFLDGSVPFGYLLMGGLTSLHGAPFAVLVGAGGCVVVLALGWLWLRRVTQASPLPRRMSQ